MTKEQIATAVHAIYEAALDTMTAKTGLSRLEVVEAIEAGVPNAVKMWDELVTVGIKAAEAHYAA